MYPLHFSLKYKYALTSSGITSINWIKLHKQMQNILITSPTRCLYQLTIHTRIEVRCLSFTILQTNAIQLYCAQGISCSQIIKMKDKWCPAHRPPNKLDSVISILKWQFLRGHCDVEAAKLIY